ncbi:MAG: heavy metal-binding domain-containing protein [Segetibacter sp.]
MKTIIMLLIATFATLGAVAQKSKGKPPAAKAGTTTIANYSCPMHAEIVSKKEGKCPKCGMDLTLSKKEQMKTEVSKLYTCPSHAEVASNSPGTCAKCSSKLVVDRRGSKQGKTVYTCPMHPNEIRDKPGKCPECGMAMEAKAKKQ